MQVESAIPNREATKSGFEDEVLISGDVLVGGQAVIEGVMMRTPNAYAVAVRLPNGSITHEGRRVARLSERHPLFKRPLLRGVAVLVQSLVLGVRALNFSAAAAAEEAGAGTSTDNEKPVVQGLSNWVLVLTISFSAVVGAGLFVVLPLYLAGVLKSHVGFFQNWLAFNLADGVIRLVVFIGYIGAMLFSRDIRRVFEYHGAEHKVVYNWEARQPLSVVTAGTFSRLHPRCGTSFLLVVMSVSIVVFSAFKFSSFWLLAGSRLVLMPLIAGLSYELIRWSARQSRDSVLFMAFKPGLMLQRLTTREPDAGQLEVAIEALNAALEIERNVAREAAKEAAA